MTDIQDDDDPFGDKAWQAEQRRKRGRGALLDAEEFEFVGPADKPPGGGSGGGGGGGGGDDDAGDDDEDDAGGEGGPGEPSYDVVRMPRLMGKTCRMVPISMPDDAPITPLGKMGRTYFYLTPLGELVSLQDSEHGQAHIEALWAPQINQLHRAFPQFNQQRQFKGFQAQYARAAMMGACGLKGIFDAHEKVRGLGCWQGDDGELIQHLGDKILVCAPGKPATEHRPGEIGGYVYPGRPPMIAPKAGGRTDCHTIYDRLKRWNWARGEVDARLLLGQQGSTVLGAALEWRPMGFITGDAATGKSTLQRLMRGMLPRRLIATVDASEAALRGLLGQDSVGVSFDEIEADALNDKAQQVMRLARTAASGDDAHRSSASQDIRSFTLRGSFLFSAIIPPSMRQADQQRFTFFRLQPLTKGAKMETLSPPEMKDLGSGLVGRITEAWPRWQRTLDAFSNKLQEGGHAQRGALQFGTLLAAAHVMLEDGEPTEAELEKWCGQLKRETLFEYENSEPSWLQCWRHLMSAQPEVWRGDGFPTVAEMVRKYLVAAGAEQGEDERKKIHDKLTRAGLAIVRQRGTQRVFLAVPPRHQAIAGIFAGSDFQKRGGEGAWTIPLRNAPKVESGIGTSNRENNRGILHVDKVPRLERQKCTLYWLDGQAEISGQWTPIFDRLSTEEDIDAPSELSDRVATFRSHLEACSMKGEAETIWARSAPLRTALVEQDGPDGAAEIEALFNETWSRLP